MAESVAAGTLWVGGKVRSFALANSQSLGRRGLAHPLSCWRYRHLSRPPARPLRFGRSGGARSRLSREETILGCWRRVAASGYVRRATGLAATRRHLLGDATRPEFVSKMLETGTCMSPIGDTTFPNWEAGRHERLRVMAASSSRSRLVTRPPLSACERLVGQVRVGWCRRLRCRPYAAAGSATGHLDVDRRKNRRQGQALPLPGAGRPPRRSASPQAARRQGPIRVGELLVDPVTRRVRVGEREVELANKEFALLRALASEPRRVFTKEELLRDVWGFKTMGRTRTLDSHASRLRRKLDPEGARYVFNCWGVGYRLIEGWMSDPTTMHAWMTRLPFASRRSSGSRLQPASASPCVPRSARPVTSPGAQRRGINASRCARCADSRRSASTVPCTSSAARSRRWS